MKCARIFLCLAAGVLAGCGGSATDQIAPSAIVSLEGTEPSTMQAPADGQISVYDVSDENLVFSGLIKKGQLLVIDPVQKKVTIDGLVANTKPFYGGDSLKIQFDETK